ncbi:hypothetical protein HII12_002205 [Brettanomyces bruxellensis]|uniref:Uncharacterized protein n=1 Tax=Dekkera bruxellensis TaxID=5007 RepID=A0A8H6EW66_DEKBR|nr:hypothetical protein HII12_002205 [Brettanomyces bruxellensis]
MSSRRIFSSWWKGELGTLFTNATRGGKSSKFGHSSFFTFKSRFFHSQGARPRVRNASIPQFKARSRRNGWSVYEDLKLLSYGSHMIFFLLLPPVVKMLTTEVDVVKDDGLGDSFVEDSILGYGTKRPLAISGGSCMTSFDTQLVDIYAERRQSLTERLEKRIAELRRNVRESLAKKKKVKKANMEVKITAPNAKNSEYPTTPADLMSCLGITVKENTGSVESVLETSSKECFDVYESEIQKLFESVKLGKTPLTEYIQSMEYLVDRIPYISGLTDSQVVGLYKEAFKHVHQLGLTQLEQEVVRKAIQSTLPRDMEQKMLEISARFNRERGMRSRRRSGCKIKRFAPLSSSQTSWQDGKSALRSSWVKYMLEDSEMYVALIEVAADTWQSVGFIKTITEMFTAQTEERNSSQEHALKVAVRKLIEKQKYDEANVVVRKLKKLYGLDEGFTNALGSQFVQTALAC